MRAAARVNAWMLDAACVGKDPALFFPDDDDGSKRSADMKEAKAICDTCVVRPECLDYALRTNVEHGVWAGTSGNERKRLRRRQRVA